ncbi:hypothetical protein GCM10017581_105370 [Dactylosporangium matsuzakiense]|uniref:Uncharacterized protein n=1 Tax=Dactylosporangium matsuzakiense TaxID=53360 RepID=A0A9W6KYI0_9ACTN|nr:hypothetical protein GCM10017581_105370 [Dactylosporangium matsuzakiense]
MRVCHEAIVRAGSFDGVRETSALCQYRHCDPTADVTALRRPVNVYLGGEAITIAARS